MRNQRLRTARTVGRRTRYRAQASSARPIAVRICCSDHLVRLETGFATAPPIFPGRPVRADSPNVVTTEEFSGSLELFEYFVFDAIATAYHCRSAGNHDLAALLVGASRRPPGRTTNARLTTEGEEREASRGLEGRDHFEEHSPRGSWGAGAKPRSQPLRGRADIDGRLAEGCLRPPSNQQSDDDEDDAVERAATDQRDDPPTTKVAAWTDRYRGGS